MAELKILPVSHQSPAEAASLPEKPQLLLQEMRREAFPVISNTEVLGHMCVSLPFIFWIISLVPGLYTSFALSLLPLELMGRVFWGQTLTSFQGEWAQLAR